MELRRLGGITPARVSVSGARGSATAKETCWESGSRFGLEHSSTYVGGFILNYSDLQFVLAGPGHSGSTWLGHVIRATRNVYVTHEINYLTWTKSHHSLDHFFEETNGATILGEHSNNYFSRDGIPEQLPTSLRPRTKFWCYVATGPTPVRVALSSIAAPLARSD